MQQSSMPLAKMLDKSVNARPPGHQRDPYWQDFGTTGWRLASGTILQVLLSRKSREFRTPAQVLLTIARYWPHCIYRLMARLFRGRYTRARKLSEDKRPSTAIESDG